MKTASKKAKGREYQKAIAEILTQSFVLQEGDIVSTSMGAGGVDLKLSPAARKVFPVSVECKSWKKPPGPEQMDQAEYNTYKNTFPVVMWKPPRKNPKDTIVYVKLDDFINLIKGLDDYYAEMWLNERIKKSDKKDK